MRAATLSAALAVVVAAGTATTLSPRVTATTVAPSVTFTNGTAAAGIDFVHTSGARPEKFLVETMGSGVALFYYDNAGWLDVFLVDGGSLSASVKARARHRLYHNRGDGTFEERGVAAGIRYTAYGQGVCAGDIDNDGFVDLYITNLGPNVLYRNSGKGTFTDISAAAGVASALWGASCAFADFDRDGDLDLFVTNYVDAGVNHNPACGHPLLKLRDYCHPLQFNPYPNVLYRNDGRGRFTNISEQAGLSTLKSNGLGVQVTDVDEDGWPDV